MASSGRISRVLTVSVKVLFLALSLQTSARAYDNTVNFDSVAAAEGDISRINTESGVLVEEQWVRTYNGPKNGLDQFTAIAVDGQGNVYVTGESYGIGKDYATLKYSNTGTRLWGKRYNGPGNQDDEPVGIGVDGQGNVYVAGSSWGGRTINRTGYDFATVKYSPGGEQLWVRRYNGPGNGTDRAYAMAVDSQGNIYVTGGSEGSGTDSDFATIKYNSNGDELWVRRYNGPANSWDTAYGLAVDSQGNVYVTGESYGDGTSGDYATIKYSPEGDELWVRRYNGPANDTDVGQFIAFDSQGNAYVTGTSIGSGSDFDFATIKYSPEGDELWVRRYNSLANKSDYPRGIAVDGKGNVYVTGGSLGKGGTRDYATVKYNSAGQRLWVRRYNGPGRGEDQPNAIALDKQGNVYVTGYSQGAGTSEDWATIKYSPAGAIVWEQRYNGPASSYDLAFAMAVGNNGNVFVTGSTLSSGNPSSGWNYDGAIIKYRQYNLP
jgi:uncharacterized delta-60 repeat protein